MDEDALRVLETVVAKAGRFGHLEHLELAWTYLERAPLAVAQRSMVEAIRHVAAKHGAPDKYHATLTLAWMHLVAVHRERWSAPTFEAFLTRNPQLSNRYLLDQHYSSEVLGSADTRAAWTEPDLCPLPALVAS